MQIIGKIKGKTDAKITSPEHFGQALAQLIYAQTGIRVNVKVHLVSGR